MLLKKELFESLASKKWRRYAIDKGYLPEDLVLVANNMGFRQYMLDKYITQSFIVRNYHNHGIAYLMGKISERIRNRISIKELDEILYSRKVPKLDILPNRESYD